MHKFKNTKNKNLSAGRQGSSRHNAGFTMFFAVLISSLSLAIGLAMYDLVVRQLQLSSTTEQSQYAIYAADTAVECAFYWDFHYNTSYSIFATSTTDTAALAATNAVCNGVDITSAANGWQVSTTPTSGMTTTTLQIGTYYAILNVVKTKNPTTGVLNTTIYAHGFNTSATTSPKAVERELQVNY